MVARNMLLGTVAAWWVVTWGGDCLAEARIARARGNDPRAAEGSVARESADQAIAEKKKEGFGRVDFSYDAVGVPPGQDAQKNAHQAMAKDIADKTTHGYTDTIGARPVFSICGSMTPFLKWFALTVVVLLLLAIACLVVVNRQLPMLIERQLNAHVEGYRFTVDQATLSPILSLEIRRLTMIQTEHPDPPVAEIPRWHLSIQWRHIFSGVLVSDYVISRPTLHITLPQAKKELRDEVPIHEKGWREAVYSFYPIKINEFQIEDADVTYVDQDPSKPLHFTHLNLLAGNICNIRSPDDAYPSDLNLDGNIFGSGRIQMQGHANFLAEPHAGINADLVLQHVALEPLLPVIGRYNVQEAQCAHVVDW